MEEKNLAWKKAASEWVSFYLKSKQFSQLTPLLCLYIK